MEFLTEGGGVDRDLDGTGRKGGGGVLLATSYELICSRVNGFDAIINGFECVLNKRFQ